MRKEELIALEDPETEFGSNQSRFIDLSEKAVYPSHLINNVGNYMILEKSLNIDKTNLMPEDYFPEALKQQPDFFKRNMIPTKSEYHKPDKFKDFVEARRGMILDTIKQVLIYQ